MSRYYDMAGEPIPFAQAMLLLDSDNRIVAREERGDVLVSTVLLVIDHNFGVGLPVIFETMVFGGEHDEWQDRYSTLDEALEGHQRACLMVFGPRELA